MSSLRAFACYALLTSLMASKIHQTAESKIQNEKLDTSMRVWTPRIRDRENMRVRRGIEEDKCAKFTNLDKDTFHHPGYPDNYYNNMDCITVISAPSKNEDYIISLDFRDRFHIEYYPNCTYDFLEIRDGEKGYANLIGTFCGEAFPPVITSQGPFLWLRFRSDSTIEYEGFTGVVTFIKSSNSIKPLAECFKELEVRHVGTLERADVDPRCEQGSKGSLDAVWQINVKPGWRIFLNFTQYNLALPNECKMNFIDVFGEKTEMTDRLKNYCGSMADTVTSDSHVLHVRFYASAEALPKTSFRALYTAFRNRDVACDAETEFDCDDATCIHRDLRCDGVANCRLKGDEDPEMCNVESHSLLEKTHIVVILVIFSLILSGISIAFLYKCIKKLVADHKMIKEHIRQSCEDRLDVLADSKLTLDPRLLQAELRRDSLARDNRRNDETYRKRTKPSLDSENSAHTRADIEDEPWHQDIENAENDDRSSKDKASAKARDKRDRGKRAEKEEREKSIKSRRSTPLRAIERRDTEKERGYDKHSDRRSATERSEEQCEEVRNVSVGVPDTKESGCQTRESLFQVGTTGSSDGTGTDSGSAVGFSTFGYSGCSLVPSRRPTSPPASPPPALTIEVLKGCQPHDPQPKKILDRRPMSNETTRSAPDVIIVSKPVR